MLFTALLAAASSLSGASALSLPARPSPLARRDPIASGPNPFEGKKLFANPGWSSKLDQTAAAFAAKGDAASAAKVKQVQKQGTFVWVSDRKSLTNIDDAVAAARAEQASSGVKQVVGLVLYNLPDRDCSAGESAGELSSDKDGLNLYKTEFIKPYADKVGAATDLTFAIVLEPDSLGNAVTNTKIEFCAKAIPTYEEGIAFAIKSLQFDHVNLYIDAAHGGWLGWNDNLEPTAQEFAKVVSLASSNGTAPVKIRGFSTNVSNYNPFNANPRENYTEYSQSWDESHYATTLAPHLEAAGLPARFIIDQGRVALPGARKEWGEWCNVAPAGFGAAPGSPVVNNTLVDSIVWIKPGGESDGQCGMAGATKAGQWFDEYVQMLVTNADPSVVGGATM